jgi:peroxisomal membrane protein 2
VSVTEPRSRSQRTFVKGTLCFLQEVLGCYLSGVPAGQPAEDAPLYSHLLARANVSTRAIKVALYGFLVSAPLGHVLVGELQRAFAGKTGPAAKLGQIFASNLIVSPIQTFFYLVSFSIISGSKSWKDVKKDLMGAFLPVMKVMWVSTPPAILFAQNFLAPELWSPFFHLVLVVIGTYYNIQLKKLRQSKEKDGDEKQ